MKKRWILKNVRMGKNKYSLINKWKNINIA